VTKWAPYLRLAGRGRYTASRRVGVPRLRGVLVVTGLLADTPTRGLPTRGLDNSQMPPVVVAVLSILKIIDDYVDIKHVIASH